MIKVAMTRKSWIKMAKTICADKHNYLSNVLGCVLIPDVQHKSRGEISELCWKVYYRKSHLWHFGGGLRALVLTLHKKQY